MPYRVDKNGLIECDTIDELKELARLGLLSNGHAASSRPPRSSKSSKSSKQAKGIKQSWENARRLAEEQGISVKEARSRLKAEK